MIRRHFINLLLSVFILLPGALFSQQLVEGVAAVVGDEIILKSEVEQQAYNYALQNRINVEQNPKMLERLKKEVLNSLIEQKILLNKAQEDTITVDEAMVDQRLEERMNYMIERAGSEDELEKIFGKSMSSLRRDARERIREQMLVEQVRAAKFQDVKVSRREVEQFYDAYKDSLPKREETVEISHILMTVEASEDAQTEAFQKIKTVQEKLENGADFAELAKKYSEDPASAQRGGDLGMTSRGDFVKEFEAAAFELEEGEVSDIVRTQFGYHIIKMIERRGERIHTRHILVRLSPSESDEQKIIETLSDLRKRIMNGEDFEKLALEYSDDDNVTNDKGHLGTFEVNKLAIPEFQQIVKNLDEGEISKPFKTDYGYHIVRLDERGASRNYSIKDDWQKIEQFALNKKMQDEYQEWIAELKENISIEVRSIL